jgi:hypothetical protein
MARNWLLIEQHLWTIGTPNSCSMYFWSLYFHNNLISGESNIVSLLLVKSTKKRVVSCCRGYATIVRILKCSCSFTVLKFSKYYFEANFQKLHFLVWLFEADTTVEYDNTSPVTRTELRLFHFDFASCVPANILLIACFKTNQFWANMEVLQYESLAFQFVQKCSEWVKLILILI